MEVDIGGASLFPLVMAGTLGDDDKEKKEDSSVDKEEKKVQDKVVPIPPSQMLLTDDDLLEFAQNVRYAEHISLHFNTYSRILCIYLFR